MDSADLVDLDGLFKNRERKIDGLISQLNEANRELQDAIEMDERKHTITRNGSKV